MTDWIIAIVGFVTVISILFWATFTIMMLPYLAFGFLVAFGIYALVNVIYDMIKDWRGHG